MRILVKTPTTGGCVVLTSFVHRGRQNQQQNESCCFKNVLNEFYKVFQLFARTIGKRTFQLHHDVT